MKHLFYIQLILILISCSENQSDFLEKFNPNENDKYVNTIDSTSLKILTATNEVNTSVYNVNHKYYYGYKRKIDNNLYVVSYMDIYTPLNHDTNRLLGWYDIFECIYDSKRDIVTSKLRIWSSEPILSTCKIINKTYIITSLFRISLYNGETEQTYFENKTLINKYKIIGNQYVCIE